MSRRSVLTNSAAVFRIVGRIYEAAGTPNEWAACLASIRELLQGTAAHFVHHDYRRKGGGISAAAGLDPAAIHAYGEYFHAVDPWAHSAELHMDTLQPGDVVLGQSLVSHARMLKTEYYADLGKPYDLTRCLAGYLEKPTADTIAVLSINRSDRAPEFGVHEARIMRLLMPHLRRALTLHHRLTNIDAERAAAADVLERLSTGVILLDGRLRPVFVNRAAGRIIAQRDGLFVEKDELRAGTSDLTNALRRMAAAAAAVTTGKSIDLVDPSLTISRPSGRQPLHVVMTPVTRLNEYAGNVARAAVAVFITDPDTVAVPNSIRLQQLFRFTPTEARVAVALAEGQTVEEISASLRSTRDATRWHIKQALAKVGASRQAQLVSLVLNPSSLGSPDEAE